MGAKMVTEIFEKHRILVKEIFSPLTSPQRKILCSLLKEIEPI